MSLNRFALANITQLKEYLNYTSSDKDTFFENVLNRVTSKFNEFCDRELTECEVTEYYDGDGTRELYLKHFPIVKVVSCYDDPLRTFGSGDLVSLDDILIYAELGKIRLFDNEDAFSKASQNIKINYWGGYKILEVFSGENDKLNWTEDGGTELTATLTAGRYDIQGLCDHLKTLMDAQGGTYLIKYNHGSNHITISETASDASLVFKWSTGTNASVSCGWLIGADTSSDSTAATEWESDYEIFPLPDELIQACIEQASWIYRQSFKKDGIVGIKSRSVAGQSFSTEAYERDSLLPQVQAVLKKYRWLPYV